MEGMEKQLTSIEWFVNEIPVIDWEEPYWKNKLYKAKEMEKQQLGKFYNHGQWTTVHGDTFEEHYNKIFKIE